MSATTSPVSIKETLTSIMIAFMVALVFRGFVVEGFQIPTGSMAPTLLGANVLNHSDVSGYTWTSEPWYRDNRNIPFGVQQDLRPTDPMSGIELPPRTHQTRSGDRVFVFKYLEPMHGPQRFDVTVFKVPIKTSENYIKRLVGMPGEQLAFVDGDIFTRPLADSPAAWSAEGWRVQRKPERIQRAVWQTIFDARFAPRASASYRPPVRAASPGWSGLDGGPVWTYANSAPTRLEWLNRTFRLDDYLPYNELPSTGQRFDRSDENVYPVSDLSISMGLEPGGDDASAAVVIAARGHEFRGLVSRAGGSARAAVQVRPQTEAGDGAWLTIHEAEIAGSLSAGRVSTMDFWHVDQALWLFVDGQLAAGGPETGAYDWSLADRLDFTAGSGMTARLDADTNGHMLLISPDYYPAPSLSIEFEGGPMRVHNVAVARDLFYRPTMFSRTEWPGDPSTAMGRPALGTHPASPLMIGTDQFLMCGDNSARSLDGRAWGAAHPAMYEKYPTRPGLVHRDMLIGRAFVVYFPAPQRRFGLPIFDFGRMRWIW